MSKLVDNPEEYFRTFLPKREQLLIDLEEEARREDIPIVGPMVGELLYILAKVTRAERVLELGTATGYSTIFLARSLASRAAINFHRAGLDQQIEIVVGDAQKKLAEMVESFDFMFLDIEKENYADILPHCHRLLKQGGLLVADNVGFKDADPFNRLIFESSEWRSVSLFAYLPFHSPEKDGLCLAVRI
jgi:predicted O-methyltransferase YrrM